MLIEMDFKRASRGGSGANAYVYYEELLALEDAGMILKSKASAERAIRFEHIANSTSSVLDRFPKFPKNRWTSPCVK